MEKQNLIKEASKALRRMAIDEKAKNYIINNEELFRFFKKAANRYIAGEQLDDVHQKVKSINSKQVSCTVDFMGENTRSVKVANDSTYEFLQLAKLIKREKLDCTISLDLSHIGLLIDHQFGLENLQKICSQGIEVMISAEGIEFTDIVLETYLEASKHINNIGITLQAYLHRSDNDLKELMRHQGKIRIVKGAFDTPSNIALERGESLNEKYLYFVQMLLNAKHKCSIATHDKKIQDSVVKILKEMKSPDNYEFESLLGIENDNLIYLSGHHPTKIYVVYGMEWYLYLCNRIAEYPPSIFQVITDLMSENG